VRVGESPSADVGWLNSSRRREPPKKRTTALRRFMLGEVKCAALR